MDNRMPTEVDTDFWINAEATDDYYENLDDSYLEFDFDELGVGKWMLFVKTEDLDDIWTRVRNLTVKDQLGSSAKTATMKPNHNARNSNEKVICVYVTEASDFVEVASLLWKLFDNGVVPDYQKYVAFKTDKATMANQYVKGTKKSVSKFKMFPKEIHGKSVEEFIDYFKKEYFEI
jgi:hypothetical protein